MKSFTLSIFFSVSFVNFGYSSDKLEPHPLSCGYVLATQSFTDEFKFDFKVYIKELGETVVRIEKSSSKKISKADYKIIHDQYMENMNLISLLANRLLENSLRKLHLSNSFGLRVIGRDLHMNTKDLSLDPQSSFNNLKDIESKSVRAYTELSLARDSLASALDIICE